MKQPKPATIDFETFGIEGRPDYPPKPVGVSIQMPGRKPKYYAFGHPEKNNCTEKEAIEATRKAYQCKDGALFQNGKFDVDVAEVHFGLPVPHWQKVHDTMFLLFLDDPHQKELGLKPASERLLNMPAEEQDAVCEWLLKHQPIPGVKISKSKKSPHYFGRYIAYAPGDLVGSYADGDTDRTTKLFKLLWKKTADRGMLEAYDRERRLMPVLLEMERQGVPVNLPQLRSDVRLYTEWLEKINAWVIKRIKADEDINLDSGPQLVKAMMASDKVDPGLLPLTPTGKYQTNKEALLLGVTDKILLSVLKYRSQLKTCLNTFMKPWLKVAERSKGFIFTTWNQTKQEAGGGARTGRLSSSPNFQNIPNTFSPIFKHEGGAKSNLPKCPFKGLPPLPKIRSYIIPFKGQVFIDRDYSQQEPRILAHFEDGELKEKYNSDPWMDVHDSARNELASHGRDYPRKPIKNINLGLIYGMGVPLLAKKNDMPVDETKELKKAILNLYPGLRDMYKDMKVRAANNIPIRTWGGREYYCEPPKLINGRIRQFDYKLVNVLVQGSAADCTKEALIRLWNAIAELGKVGKWRIVLNVHDQITVSVPKRDMKKAMMVLQQCMESVEFDVPILSEGSVSDTNWEELRDYDKKGVLV